MHLGERECSTRALLPSPQSFWAIGPTLLVFIINPQDERTPLHLAKDAEVVRVLVDAGADVNAKDKVRK